MAKMSPLSEDLGGKDGLTGHSCSNVEETRSSEVTLNLSDDNQVKAGA